ncbi:MAG: L-seryl-tRNA(Sec) selenium transferase [Anaerolineaceae bacterium]|nr:L-seryl-tRNA(Sec) selenium transferase [Anaerolineaceae bacterium]
MSADLRALPAVEALLQTQQAANLVAEYGRPLTLEAIRAELTDLRRRLKENGELTIPERGQILDAASDRLESWLRTTLVPVINATGVVLHTNLGRAPLSRAAMNAAQSLTTGYCTLEYDLAKGVRGSRSVHAEELLKHLTGAEAALVVNNNAAALLLCLSALARRQRVVIARSQLVEIGGGFRVPDVMNQSGAKLVEVGTTNRVHRRDFEEALNEPAALVLRAHHSNFRILGFTTEPSLEELVEVAHARGVIVLDDLGSGALLNTEQYGLAHEPTVQESMKAGADLICFSGDKLLGGPQAGIIIGKADLVAKVKKHPLARAVRADKLALGVLAVTLTHYLKNEAEREIPIWRMIGTTPEQIEARAQRWRAVLDLGEVIEAHSAVGGGSLPEETLRTFVLALNVPQPNKFLARLRAANPPVIARVENELVVFDPRTVLPEEEGALLVAVKNILGKI